MTNRRALVLTILLVAAPTASDASDRPVAVSPGHASRLVRVGDRCPTFSWGQVPGTDRYELVVYRLGRDEEEAPAVLRATIDGRAGSWTPTLDRCLAGGRSYAWSLRARRGDSISPWSAPALFQVASGPDAAELEQALAVMRDYATARGTHEGRADGADLSNKQATKTAPNEGGNESEDRDDRGPGTISLSVAGRIEAASFSGDGSALANVAAADLSCSGCVAGGEIGDGAVTAAKIGESCALGQVLSRGAAGWQCATLTAPACTPGDELSCYTGPGGTRGVGECLGGTRICAADSSWGACSGQITPAATESCDGLDNTCDGLTDEGDPALLCPLTANVASTLCDAAACGITGCDALWTDANGDYLDGCEAPAAGLCLDGGVPRPVVAPSEGNLVIQELLADPASPLTDAAAEWFEVAVTADVDLNGLGIGTTFGTVIDQIDVADCLSVEDGDLLLFARSADPATNGNLAADQIFSFSLVNGGGDLHLSHGGNLVDAVSWSAADIAAGRARNLPPGLQNATSNDDQANWCTVAADAGLLYSAGNHGTPGLVNIACP